MLILFKNQVLKGMGEVMMFFVSDIMVKAPGVADEI